MDTSPFAYEYALRNMRIYPASQKMGGSAAMAQTHLTESTGMVFGALVWLYRLFIRMAVGDTPVLVSKDTAEHSGISRINRRFLKRNRMCLDLEKVKIQLYIDRLMFGGLTSSQKQEKLARISPRGRIAVYGLRYWGTRFQARARLACYDHGWWRMPTASAVAGGMWDVQLPPN